MKRIVPISFILIICLISSACSQIVNFVVVNQSDFPVELEYALSRYSPENQTLSKELIPAKIDLANWERRFGSPDWQELAQEEFQFDSTTGKIKIEIAPKQVVKIIHTNDLMYFVDDYNRFEIKRLEIKGENGTIILEGQKLFKQFEEKNYSNRFIVYK